MSELSARLEALLLLATEPVPAADMAAAVEAPLGEVEAELGALADFYTESGRGFELREVGGGWRYYTRPEHDEVVRRWLLDVQEAKLSTPALETLAVVAYLQPIARGRISSIRGVNVDGVVRTLMARGLIESVGKDEASGANLYGTTPLFLEKLGIAKLEDLPPIAPYLPDASLLEEELAALANQAPPEPTLEDAAEADSGDKAEESKQGESDE
ncbi:MAG: SMC-Scp complex subunit ScpB [Propionibacteriaceae bacterium]|jgi:segregation and condensation protein B|nr:SMC-Scp complex subunit ScpB [Propionibacteriaceae bacterium]